MNFANKISTFRILSVPFFIACLLYYTPQRDHLRLLALFIFIIAVISDIVDGYIARRKKEHSPAGLILDPLGDKILLVSAFIFLRLVNTGIRFPIWVTLIVVSRDAIIILGIIAIFIVRQKFDMMPTIWGKLTTIFQMASVISVLMRLSFSHIFWSIAISFTLISGINYIRRGFIALYGSSGNNN